MDPGPFTQDADLAPNPSEIGLPEGSPTQASGEPYRCHGVTPLQATHLFLPEAFYSIIPRSQVDSRAAEGDLAEADEDLAEVRYHPGYLSLYPNYVLCSQVPQPRQGTGYFQPLICFTSEDGTLGWQTHSPSTTQLYLTELLLYTVERYFSSCANLPAGQPTLSGGYIGRAQHINPTATSPDATALNCPSSRSAGTNIEGFEDEAEGVQDTLDDTAGLAPDSKGSEPQLRLESASPILGRSTVQTSLNLSEHTKEQVVMAKAESVKDRLDASTGLGPDSKGSEAQLGLSVLPAFGNSTIQTSLNLSEHTKEQVVMAKAVDLDPKPAELVFGSLQDHIPSSPSLTGVESRYSDSQAEIASSQLQPEDHSGDASPIFITEKQEDTSLITGTDTSCDLNQNSRDQKEMIGAAQLSIEEKWNAFLYGIEKREEAPVPVAEFKGDFLDKEEWPALQTTTANSKSAGLAKTKIRDFECDVESVKDMLHASARTPVADFRASEAEGLESASQTSRSMTSLNLSDDAEEPVLMATAVDLDAKPTQPLFGSLEDHIPSSPSLTGVESRYSDSQAEIASSQLQPEDHSGDASPIFITEKQEDTSLITGTDTSCDLNQNSRDQKEMIGAAQLSIEEKWNAFLYGIEKREEAPVPVAEFKGDFLDKEEWPALQTTTANSKSAGLAKAKIRDFECDVESVKDVLDASAGTPVADFRASEAEGLESASQTSRSMTTLNLSDDAEEPVLMATAVDLDAKPTQPLFGSLEDHIPSSPSLTGIQSSYLDSQSEGAPCQCETEDRSGDDSRILMKKEQDAARPATGTRDSNHNSQGHKEMIGAQVRVEEMPTTFQDPSVPVIEFKEDFLDKEEWPAIQTTTANSQFAGLAKTKIRDFEGDVDSVKDRLDASARTPMADCRVSEAKGFESASPASGSSTNQISLISSENPGEQVLLAKALDLDPEPMEILFGSLQSYIPCSASLTGAETSCLDIEAEIAPFQLDREPEDHSANASPVLIKKNQETTSISHPSQSSQQHEEMIGAQVRTEEKWIAFRDPLFGIPKLKKEEPPLPVVEFNGDLLDEEQWPALHTPAPKPKTKEKQKKDSKSQPSSLRS